ncbi:MAG TPA: hypothetical protein VFN56_04655 [Candidatus Saccharimonadales bacterium]|nr:hypothetical protein [Candidatus Saccharimonadales bacterium]
MANIPSSNSPQASNRSVWGMTKRYASAIVPVAIFFGVISFVRAEISHPRGAQPSSPLRTAVIVLVAGAAYGVFVLLVSLIAAKSRINKEDFAVAVASDFPGSIDTVYTHARGNKFNRNAGPGFLTFYDDKLVFTPLHHGKPNPKRPGFVFLKQHITNFRTENPPVGAGPFGALNNVGGPDILFTYGVQTPKFYGTQAEIEQVLTAATKAGLVTNTYA